MNVKTQLHQTLSSQHFPKAIRWIEYMGRLSLLNALHPSKANWNEMIGLFFMKGLLPTGKVLIASQENALKALNFQYRLLHRILPTKPFLTKTKIKQDPNYFCHNHHENLIHLLQDCEIVSPFWENMTEKLKQCSLISINYQKNISIYLGVRPDTSQFSLQLNFCFLLARHHIQYGAAGQITRLRF